MSSRLPSLYHCDSRLLLAGSRKRSGGALYHVGGCLAQRTAQVVRVPPGQVRPTSYAAHR